MEATTGVCVRCHVREGGLVQCAVCGADHHANCFNSIGRCAVPACAGKHVRDDAAESRGASAIPAGGAVEVADPDRLVIDFESNRELALTWCGHASAALAVLQIALGGYQTLFVGFAAAAVGAYWVRANIEDHWVLDAKQTAVLLHRRFFGSTSVTRFAAFTDLTELTLVQSAGYRHLDEALVAETALAAGSRGRYRVGPRPRSVWSTESKLQLDWQLSLGLADGRQVDLWWPERDETKPSEQLIATARLLEKITGLKLKVRVAPPRMT